MAIALFDWVLKSAGEGAALASLLSLPFPPTAELARAAGLTRLVHADSDGGLYSYELLVSPEADLDSTFLAFDLDAGELIAVNRWLYLIEDRSA